jgi:hypothetical protein
MKAPRSFAIAAAALALVSLISPSQARAQSNSSFYVTPWIGVGFYAGSVGLEISDPVLSAEKAKLSNAPAYGLFIGGRVSNLIIEGVFSLQPSTVLVEGTIADGTLLTGYGVTTLIYGGNVGYAFSTSKTSVVPYLSAGAGGISISPDKIAESLATSPTTETSFMFNFGGGLEIPIKDTVQLRLDVRDYIGSFRGEFAPFPAFEELGGEKSSLHNIIIAAGVTFRTQ